MLTTRLMVLSAFVDINECKFSSPCDQNVDCYNSPGSFKCICRGGYEGDGKRNGTGCSSVHKTEGIPFVNIALGKDINLYYQNFVLSVHLGSEPHSRRKKVRRKELKFKNSNVQF